MIRVPSSKIALILLLFSISEIALGQGAVFSIMGGPTMSTQTINGFGKDPFFRFHFKGVMESSSDISPNAAYLALGYHVKGSAVNSRGYNGPERSRNSSSMEFHNISLSAGVKQRMEVGENFLSYGFGARMDYNLSANFDPIFIGLAGTQNQFTYGLDIDIGFEYPLSELVSTTIELGFSPDLSAQIFIPRQDTGYQNPNGQPVIIQESFIKNVIFEARIGFRFWRKIEYVD